MQFKKTLVRLLLFLFPSLSAEFTIITGFFILLPIASWSQTTYFPQGDKQNILLERLEIKAGTIPY